MPNVVELVKTSGLKTKKIFTEIGSISLSRYNMLKKYVRLESD